MPDTPSPAASDSSAPVRIAFVCLGNICRSPLAEALFRQHAARLGISDRVEIRSMGTGNWHVGHDADARTVATAARHGVDLSGHVAAQFGANDLADFDHVFVMDKGNLADVLALDTDDAQGQKVRLVREFDPRPGEYFVPDPYTGGAEGFEHVHAILDRTTASLAAALKQEYGW